MLACGDDLRVLENFTYGDTPSPDSLRALMRHLLDQTCGQEYAGQAIDFDISLYDLASSYDVRPLVINTLLTYLELDQWIVATRKFFTTYKVKFTRSLEHLLQGFNPSRQKFLTALFSTAEKARLWHTINPEEAAAKIGEPREKILKALTYLEDLGDINVQPSGVRQGYRLLKNPDDLAALTTRMTELFQKREHSDISRLQQVTTYAQSPTCLNQFLLSYFGEESEPCGQCSSCKNPASVNHLPSSPSPEITAEELTLVQELINEKHAGLRSPRQLARFLTGLTSPATSRTWYLPEGARRKIRPHPTRRLRPPRKPLLPRHPHSLRDADCGLKWYAHPVHASEFQQKAPVELGHPLLHPISIIK